MDGAPLRRDEMKIKWVEAINELREAGYAVTVFTPGEMHGTSPIGIEEAMVEAGENVIECNQEG